MVRGTFFGTFLVEVVIIVVGGAWCGEEFQHAIVFLEQRSKK